MKSRLKSQRQFRSSNADAISQFTEVSILLMAKSNVLWVERYGDRYARFRKLVSKLSRRKLLELIGEVDNGAHYKITAAGIEFIREHNAKQHEKLVKQLRVALN